MSLSGKDLIVSYCDLKAATYAVKHWHYSKSLPASPIVSFGVWEYGQFIGCVLFSKGANRNLHRPYNLEQHEVCELTRIALNKHKHFVSQIMMLAIKELKKKEEGLRLIVSYADPAEGHVGAVYQATNWLYTGESQSMPKWLAPDGRVYHNRVLSKNGKELCKRIDTPPKHRYIMPLDKETKKRLLHLSLPYPKKVDQCQTTNQNQTNQS